MHLNFCLLGKNKYTVVVFMVNMEIAQEEFLKN